MSGSGVIGVFLVILFFASIVLPIYFYANAVRLRLLLYADHGLPRGSHSASAFLGIFVIIAVISAAKASTSAAGSPEVIDAFLGYAVLKLWRGDQHTLISLKVNVQYQTGVKIRVVVFSRRYCGIIASSICKCTRTISSLDV